MDYQELLFATAVRQRIGEFRQAQRYIYQDSLDEIGDAKAAKMAQWDEEHPLGSFIKEVYEEFELIAKIVREIRSEAEVHVAAGASTGNPAE